MYTTFKYTVIPSRGLAALYYGLMVLIVASVAFNVFVSHSYLRLGQPDGFVRLKLKNPQPLPLLDAGAPVPTLPSYCRGADGKGGGGGSGEFCVLWDSEDVVTQFESSFFIATAVTDIMEWAPGASGDTVSDESYDGAVTAGEIIRPATAAALLGIASGESGVVKEWEELSRRTYYPARLESYSLRVTASVEFPTLGRPGAGSGAPGSGGRRVYAHTHEELWGIGSGQTQ